MSTSDCCCCCCSHSRDVLTPSGRLSTTSFTSCLVPLRTFTASMCFMALMSISSTFRKTVQSCLVIKRHARKNVRSNYNDQGRYWTVEFEMSYFKRQFKIIGEYGVEYKKKIQRLLCANLFERVPTQYGQTYNVAHYFDCNMMECLWHRNTVRMSGNDKNVRIITGNTEQRLLLNSEGAVVWVFKELLEFERIGERC